MNIAEYNGEEDLEKGYTKEFYTNEIKKLYKAVGWDEENQRYTGETQPVKWVRIHNLPDCMLTTLSTLTLLASIVKNVMAQWKKWKSCTNTRPSQWAGVSTVIESQTSIWKTMSIMKKFMQNSQKNMV